MSNRTQRPNNKERFQQPGAHWKLINGLVILGFALSGFFAPEPLEFDNARYGITFCTIVVIIIPPSMIIWLNFTKSDLRRPTWDRCPFGSRDPLQLVFVGTWCALA